MFGISKEQLQEKLHELSTNLRDYVDRYAIKEFDRKLENLTGRVEATGEVAKGNGSRIDELTSLVERYERRLSSQDERIRELEKSQERSGIVSNVVKGEGQWNFEGVKELATGVSDLAYEKIRDHLLLEMAKKGYEDRHLSQFAIYDQESGATLRFYNSDYNGFEETGNLSGISTWGTKKPESVENKDRGKLLVIEMDYIFNGCQYITLSAKTNNASKEWEERLREDLPMFAQAFMLGSCMNYLHLSDGSGLQYAVRIQDTYGLKDNQALLDKMRNIMADDPRMAQAFIAHYGRAEDIQE